MSCWCTSLLTTLALGSVAEWTFLLEQVLFLQTIVENLAQKGLHLKRDTSVRGELPVDDRFLQFQLDAAEGPEKALGDFSTGVRVGPGAHLPRQLAREEGVAAQCDPECYQEERGSTELVWLRDCSSVAELTEKVVDVSGPAQEGTSPEVH